MKMIRIISTVLFTLGFIYFSSFASAQNTLSAACIEKLSNLFEYKTHKKTSYALLVPGTQGWLFRTGTDFKQDFDFTPATVRGFLNLSQALEMRGTALVIVYHPTRGLVAANHIGRADPHGADFNGAAAKENYQKLIKNMQAQSLHFVGLSNFDAADTLYRKTDQHWNTHGAEAMARNVADYIRAHIPAYKDIDSKAYISKSDGQYTMQGRFNDAVGAICGETLPPEPDEAMTSFVAGASPQTLFGEETPPQIVLVGTSNSKSKDNETNFDGALKTFLRADVQNEAIPGAGYDEPMLAFLNSSRFQNMPPKILIWEIPSYYDIAGNAAFFNQALAAAAGPCTTHGFGPLTLEQTRVELPAHLSAFSQDSYLALNFDAPVSQRFAVDFEFKTGDQSRITFDRSKRYPADGMFYAVSPENQNSDAPQKLSLLIPKSMLGRSVRGHICTLPGGLMAVR